MAKDVEQKVELPVEFTPYDRNAMDFDALLANALEIEGADLLKGELFDELVGVPFCITKVTFRPGIPWPDGQLGGYVSAEAVIGSEAWMRKRKVDLEGKPFGPLDSIVINDGSTGIYRQLVKGLVATQAITLPEGPVIVGGAKGESSYDLPCDRWGTINIGELEFNEGEGHRNYGRATYTTDFSLWCPRGIRISDDYEWSPGQTGRTRYLA